jgi:predicted acetyltransferase
VAAAEVGIEVRPATEDELAMVRTTLGRGFGWEPAPEDQERFERTFEIERSRCAFDEGKMVGTAGAFSLEMAVPGGVSRCGGTSMVSVLPTHRRRGILRAMMASHLDEVKQRGEPIAALWASESSIYGRFGFGPAATDLEVRVDRNHTQFHRLAPEPAAMRIIEKEEAEKLLPELHEELWREYPGAYRRWPAWWEVRWFADPGHHRDGVSARRHAIALGETGRPTGYVQYRNVLKWEAGHGRGQVQVEDLVGSDPQAWAGLWSFVLNQDLVSTIHAYHRPPDDPLFDLLAAPRRAAYEERDSLWVRIIDVPVALGGRRYSAPGTLVLQVKDLMGMVGGRYRLEVDESGAAACEPTDDPEDIAIDAEDLGACFMGRSRFRAMARTSRLQGDEDALARADAMFTWHPQPWCSEVF